MELVKSPVIRLKGELYTSSQGVNKLMEFYSEAKEYKGVDIIVECYDLDWIDANLTAFLNALSYRLGKDNNLTFSADFDFLSKKFNVLFRNGWLQHEDFTVEDTQQTTIPCTQFFPSQQTEFIEYIDKQLMCNKGMEQIDINIRKRIRADLIEVFQNIFRHARTDDPCFICGQFYPTKNYFILTMVDLGVGFLKPIEEHTNGNINTHINAIRWALSGKSSLVKDSSIEIGGLGLEGILNYCIQKKGIFQIYTGTDFWGTDLENTVWQGTRGLKHDFQGSVLNLFFNIT